jgi:hypothetical protein
MADLVNTLPYIEQSADGNDKKTKINDDDDDVDEHKDQNDASVNSLTTLTIADEDCESLQSSVSDDNNAASSSFALVLNNYRVHRIKYRFFRDCKLKVCSESPYDVIVVGGVGTTFVVCRDMECDDPESDGGVHSIQEFEVTLTMSPLQRQLVKVGWITQDSIASYDGSWSRGMAVLARDTDTVDTNGCQTFLGVSDITKPFHMVPVANVEHLWEAKTVTVRCDRLEKSWYINGILVCLDTQTSLQQDSVLFPMITLNQGSFSFTRIVMHS